MFGLGTITRKVFGTQNDRKVNLDSSVDRKNQRIGTRVRGPERRAIDRKNGRVQITL